MSIIQSSSDAKAKIKVVMLGDQGVGKTSIIEKFIYDKFHEIGYPTVGIDFLAKDYIHKDKHVRLQLWDTAGQQRFRSLIPSYLKDSHCAIIIFDLGNRQSFESVESWLSLYKQNRSQSPLAVLVGNKSDIVTRTIQFQQADQRAKLLGVKYIQVSAKTGKNINIIFQTCLQQMFYSSFSSSKIHGQSSVVDQHSVVRPFSSQAQLTNAQPLRNDILNVQNQQQRQNCNC